MSIKEAAATTVRTSNDNDDAVWQFAITGDLVALQQEDSKKTLQARDRNGSTLLHYAAGNGHVEVCRFLLDDCGLEVHATSHKTNRTALHWAARNGQEQVCRLLVTEFHAQVDCQAKGQVTPLQLAVWKCHLETARALVQMGANASFINAWGCSVAHWLGKCPEYADSMVTIMNMNMNMNTATTKDGIKRTNTSMVKDCLLESCHWLFQTCQISYDVPNHHGQTPLHKAAFAGNLPVLEYLVEHLGVLDDTRDHLGNFASDCAEHNSQTKTAQWLRRRASPWLIQACKVLELPHNIIPSVAEIRIAFLLKAKLWHPDRAPSKLQQWNDLHESYRLLLDWWQAPDSYSVQIRRLSRNQTLQGHKAILWNPRWHQQQRQENLNNCFHNQSILQDFETNVLRLLQTHKSLPLSQLSKEYKKNWHAPVPKPRDFGCRKLGYLIQTYCLNIQVECHGNKAFLRAK